MNPCFFLFFLLPLIAAEGDDYRTVKHICLDGGIMVFQVSIMSNDTINDIFSTDPHNNCSLSNNDFVGNGTEEFPYQIVVDVSDHLNSSQKPCGAKILNGSFEVQFAIKSHEYFFLEHDRSYTIQCEINKPVYSVFTMTSVHKEVVDSNQVAVEMKLVSSENSQPISGGKLELGQNVKLKIEILKDNFAKRAHVTLCYVQAGQLNQTKLLFYNNRCPVNSFPVPINFMINETNPHLIESTDFEVFKFDKHASVEFSCFVELCSDEKDLYCLTTDCKQKGTFMRYYTKVKTTLEVYSGASKQGSFMSMSVAVILILLTKIVSF